MEPVIKCPKCKSGKFTLPVIGEIEIRTKGKNRGAHLRMLNFDFKPTIECMNCKAKFSMELDDLCKAEESMHEMFEL